MEVEFGFQYTDAKRIMMFRAVQLYAVREQTGAITRGGMRGTRRPFSYRSSGGSSNGTEARGLDFSLLDVVQRLLCRADSCMLMT